MPKRATHTFESEKDGAKDKALQSAYCLYCGTCCLVSDAPLDSLPRRRTDGATVLDPSSVVFKLLAAAGQNAVVIRRSPTTAERQWRHACVKCGLAVAYRCAPAGGSAPVPTFVIPGALGPHPAISAEASIPKAVQAVGDRSVRVALEVGVGAVKAAIMAITDTEVVVHVTSTNRRDGANAEALDLMAGVLRLPRHRLQLTRGWSHKSKFVHVAGLSRGDVYGRLRSAVDSTDGSVGRALAAGGGGGAGGADDDAGGMVRDGTVAHVGAITSSIRQQWDAAGEEDLDLAPPPEKKFKPRW